MENVQPPPTRSRSASSFTSNSMNATDVLADGVGIAKALSALDAARETRKRKRGALQDISNKKVLPPSLASSSKATGSAVVKKPVVSTNSISAVTTTTRARGATATATATSRVSVRAAGAKSSAASVSSATASKRTTAAALKKLDAVTKRRKPDGDEPHVPHKVQTSMLSFQTSSSLASTASARSSDASGLKTSAASTTVLKKLSAGSSVVRTESLDSSGAIPAKSDRPVAPSSIYTPRPYTFSYDHRGSGFDERTYAALVRDIDARAAPHVSAPCAKLARELDAYYRQHEVKYQPEATYMGTFQTDINEKMRTILVDWLIEVGEEYDLDSQTFHKAVNLVDRCLCKFKINRKQFQLLGCACMMIAAKFEEVYGPNVEEFVYISDQTYTPDEMLEMESKVLQALEYRVASTTCYGFLRRYIAAASASEKQSALVMYLSDFALLYYPMLKYRPSQIAASAVYLARFLTGESEPWTPTLHHYAKYNAWDLQSCVLELGRLHKIESDVVATQRDKAKAVSEKYFADKFFGVSAIPAADEATLEQSFFQYDQRLQSSRSSAGSASS